jgi:hypothetical protein
LRCSPRPVCASARRLDCTDIDPALAALLRDYLGSSRRIRLFESRNGSPLVGWQHPQSSAAAAACETRDPEGRTARVPAFPGHLVTQERYADLQKLRIGHSNANKHSE